MSGCEEYEALANLALDEEATLEEIAELNRHLETCPDCRAYYEDLKRIHEACAPGKLVLPEGFSDRVMARVRETAQDPKAKPEKKLVPFPHWGRWAALAACCAIVVLSAWAAGNLGGVKKDSASVAQMSRSADTLPEDAAQTAEDFHEDEIAVLSEEPPPALPEEYEELAKSAAKDGPGEGQYQPLENDSPAPDAEPAGGSMPEYGFNCENAPPASDGADLDRDGADEVDGQPAMTDAAESPAEDTENKENLEDTEIKEDPEASVPEPAPLAPEETVEPVEIINAPEPGILIAYGGGAAQSWVESVLGLEWAAGGSYPLSAEQYGALVDLLDQAGEPYQIEPGEGYCLMTE